MRSSEYISASPSLNAAGSEVVMDVLQQQVDKHSYLSASEITPLEGGLPLLSDSVVVGAIGVSGASAEEDSQIAAAGSRILTT